MVADTRSDEVQSGCDTIEIANHTSGDWQQFITGHKEWSMNTSWLLPEASDLGRLLQAVTTVTIRILWRCAVKGLTDTDIVKTFKITNTRGNISYQWRDNENEIRIINLE